MRHYEVVVLIHQDHSHQAGELAASYQSMITEAGGKIHRFEDWGLRPLAYLIQKVRRAHYLLLNIECSTEALEALKTHFRFSDVVLRQLIQKRGGAVTDPSAMLQAINRRAAADAERAEAKKADAR